MTRSGRREAGRLQYAPVVRELEEVVRMLPGPFLIRSGCIRRRRRVEWRTLRGTERTLRRRLERQVILHVDGHIGPRVPADGSVLDADEDVGLAHAPSDVVVRQLPGEDQRDPAVHRVERRVDEITLVRVEHERGPVQDAQLGKDVCLEEPAGLEATLQSFRIRDLVRNVGWVVTEMGDHRALLGDIPALMRDGGHIAPQVTQALDAARAHRSTVYHTKK